MSEAPTCPMPNCGKPIHDTAYVCSPCAQKTATAIDRAAGLLGNIVETIARQDRVTDGARSRAKPQSRPAPNLGASVAYGTAKGELSTWARHVCEERGIDIPADILGALKLLERQVDWLRYRPEAEEALRAIGDACRQIERIPDNHDTKILVGWCPCQTRLHVRHRSAETTTCSACGTQYDVPAAKAQLLEWGRDQRVSAAEAADILVGWDSELKPQRERCRNLINQWATRGLIEATEDGYRLGQLCDRWTNALAARVA